MFSCEFCEISKNTFFTEHLRATASIDEFTLAQKKLLPLEQLKERPRINEATYAFSLNFFYLSFRSGTFSMHPLFYPCFIIFLCLCNDSFLVFYKFLYYDVSISVEGVVNIHYGSFRP